MKKPDYNAAHLITRLDVSLFEMRRTINVTLFHVQHLLFELKVFN